MMVNSLWPMAISEKKQQQFRLKWKAQPQQNLLSRLLVIGWTCHTRGVLMLRCLTVITTDSGFAWPALPPLSAPNTPHSPITTPFFSWGQRNQVSLNRVFILKKGKKERGCKRRFGPLWELNASCLTLAKKNKTPKKKTKHATNHSPPYTIRYAKWPIKIKCLGLWASVVFLGEDSFSSGQLVKGEAHPPAPGRGLCSSPLQGEQNHTGKKQGAPEPPDPWNAATQGFHLSPQLNRGEPLRTWGIKLVPVFALHSFWTKGAISVLWVCRTQRGLSSGTTHSRRGGLGAAWRHRPAPQRRPSPLGPHSFLKPCRPGPRSERDGAPRLPLCKALAVSCFVSAPDAMPASSKHGVSEMRCTKKKKGTFFRGLLDSASWGIKSEDC